MRKNSVMIRAYLVRMLLLLSGCAAMYPQPQPGEKSAQLQLKAFFPRTDYYNAELISAFEDDQCTRGPKAGQLAELTWVRQKESTVRVRADQRLYLKTTAITTRVPEVGRQIMTQVTNLRCTRVTSFVPQDGHTYTLSLRAEIATDCPVELVDAATLNKPDDLQFLPVSKACAAAPLGR